jgi:hypothetical protein
MASNHRPADLVSASQGRPRHGDVCYILYFFKTNKLNLLKHNKTDHITLRISEVFFVTPHMKCVF